MLYPINEIFGPTIQGEGVLMGQITHFVRFSGCNFDCLWCDTKYAVNPKYAGWSVTEMTASEVVNALRTLHGEAGWVTLSGGNPALFADRALLFALHDAGFKVAMETQWIPRDDEVFIDIDHLVYSPKPPSSGMHTRYGNPQWNLISSIIIDRLIRRGIGKTSLKIVVFDERDLAWAKETEMKIENLTLVEDSWVPRVLSVGTPRPEDAFTESQVQLVDNIVESTLKLLEMVNKDPYFKHHRITPQLHAILWGRKRGV